MGFQVGQIIIGKVESVKPYALFMSFEGDIKGLLHISEISDGYIRDIEKYGVVGDELKVKVLSIDPTNGFLRVSFKQVPSEESFTTHKEGQKNSPIAEQGDFSPLAEKLPTWIEETLKKAKEGK